jgi:hypothetical protein
MMENIYLAEKIKKLLYEMSSIHTTIQRRDMIADFRDEDSDNDEDHEYDLTTWEYCESFREYAGLVYKLILSYVEEKNQPNYLAEIKTVLQPLLVSQRIREEHDNRSADGSQNLFLHEIWAFLSAYEVFGQNDLSHLMRRTGINYLETILRNTAVIIHHRKITPKNETDVYKAVADVCMAVYPASSNLDSPFIKIAGEYKPDVLIPALNCAVEYKYAKTQAKLKSTIEGILGDVQNYSDHPIYKIFDAVFYVKPDIWGAQKFDEVWKQNKFPPNWKGIYIVG